MAEIVKTIEIKADVQTVFQYVANPHNGLNFMPNFTRFAPHGQPEQGLGAKVDAVGSFKGVEFKTQLEIVEFEPNQRFVSRSTQGVKSMSIWQFKALPNGNTLVTFTSDYTLPGKTLGWLLDKMVMEKDVEKTTQQTLVNLKQVIEKGKS